MKYFTKEWYQLCQKTFAHLPLKESAEAESFSEEYFQRLYEEKLNEWLTLQKDVAAVQFEDIFPEEMNTDFITEALSENEILELKEEYRINREAAKVKFEERKPYDADKETENFEKRFLYRLEEAGNLFPQDILDMIADRRVFVLDVASKPVVAAVTKFCEGNRENIESTGEKYRDYYDKQIVKLDKEAKYVFGNIQFHDCIIKEVRKSKQKFVLLLDNSGGFTNIEEIRFENYEIIKQEYPLEETWWLYEEVYYINGRYEVHALLLINNNVDRLVEFTISAEQISFREGYKKFHF